MSYDNRVVIERAVNGYMVTMRDPKIVKRNQQRDLNNDGFRYMEPDKEYVFADIDALNTFLKANLDKALPKEDYASSFDLIADEDDD